MAVVTLHSPPDGVPDRVIVQDEPRVGGEGAVFFSADGNFAVKVYHNPPSKKQEYLRRVIELFSNLSDTQKQFVVPPLALVSTFDGSPKVGFIMRRVPQQYRELLEFTYNPRCAAQQFQQGKTWAHYLKVARSVANAIMVLHGKGCAHSDIHFRNFLANLDTGQTVMLEMDGVVVQGFLPPGVKGMLGFMAPELIKNQQALPDEKTDRYSLALLILHTLLFRNVMCPLRDYDSDPNVSEELGWGQYAVFSEHPTDHRHRPNHLGTPLYRRGTLSYKMLTPRLQALTEKAFIDGLHNPGKRPTAREWEEALAFALDELWHCSECRQFYPYPYKTQPPQQRTCPFCGDPIRQPYPAVLELYEERRQDNFVCLDRRLVLGHSFRVFEDVIEPHSKPPFTRQGARTVGHVEWDGNRGTYRLFNDSNNTWTAGSPDGKSFTVRSGESLVLSHGTRIQFGSGKRIARVIEPNQTT